MPVTCPICGRPAPEEAAICPHCGHPLAAAAVSGPAPGDVNVTMRLGARLRVDAPGQPPYELPLTGALVTIGREPGNTIAAPFMEVSRHHAQIGPYDGGFAILDLSSVNGTYVRGQRIAPNQPVLLAEGDVARIGDQAGNSIAITYLSGSQPAPAGTTGALGQHLLGTYPRLVLGRDPAVDLPLPSPVVSRQHAALERIPGGHQLADLGSTNGTFVNGQRVRTTTLHPGDVIQIGPYRLIYSPETLQPAAQAGQMRLDAIGLRRQLMPSRKEYWAQFARWLGSLWRGRQEPLLPRRRAILNDVSLTVLPGEFVALVGSSGAGKSTLMDALNGYRRASAGRVLVNGEDLYACYDLFRTSLGYVPQADILHMPLPVGRALDYTARLRLPADTSPEERQQLIQRALQQVDMLAQRDQPIASLSGGQRKRVSIAAELLSDPALFFLDEPTSGLDPGLDKKMMSTLRLLADSGRTIVLTTHATNNIEGQCDQVAFMAEGRLVYFGPPAAARQFFQVQNFADIYTRLEPPSAAEGWQQAFQQGANGSQAYQELVAGRQAGLAAYPGQGCSAQVGAAPQPISAWRQLGILSRRYLDLIRRDAGSLFVLLAVMPIIGLLLLPITKANALVGDSPAAIQSILQSNHSYQIAADTQRLLLMLVLAAFFFGLFASAYEIVKEKPVYRRERMVNLQIFPYLLSKLVVLMGFGLVQVLLLLEVVGMKVHYPSAGVIFEGGAELFITLWLALLVGVCLGLLVSAVVKSRDMVIYLILIALFVQVFFAGVLFELSGLGRVIAAVTPARWAMEALGITVDLDRLNGLAQTYLPQVQQAVPAPLALYLDFTRSPAHLLGAWLVLILFAAGLLLLAALVLKRQDRI